MTAKLIEWAVANGCATIEKNPRGVEVLIIDDRVFLDDTTVTDLLQWRTNPNLVWQHSHNARPVDLLTAIVEKRLENLRYARGMLENKSFGISIRAEQDEIDAKSHELRKLLP